MSKVYQNVDIDKKLKHEFDIVTTVNKAGSKVYSLYYSNCAPWNLHIRGQLILTLTDTGNSIKIKFKESTKLKQLDYSQVNYLTIILKFISKENKLKTKFKE